MPTDPSIILAAGNIQGPTPQDTMSMFAFAQQVQQMRRQQQGQMVLRDIFSNPDSLDSNTGLPKPQALQAVTRVDPELGIKMQGEIYDTQAKQFAAKLSQSDAGKAQLDLSTKAAAAATEAYDDAVKAGRTPDDAMSIARTARNEVISDSGGAVGDGHTDKMLAAPLDINGARALARLNPEYESGRRADIMQAYDLTKTNISAAAAGLPVPGVNTPDKNSPAAIVDIIPSLERSGDNIVSKKGAVGRYQIEPGTAKQYGFDPDKLTDPDYAKTAATAIISDLSKKYPGDRQAVLAAYNWGPGNVDKWIANGRDPSKLPAETRSYIARADAQAASPSPITTGGKGWEILKDNDGTAYRYNPSTTVATTLDGKPYKPSGAAKLGGGDGANFTPQMGDLMASLAEHGVAVPAGFRSKAQQAELYQGLLNRNPGKNADEIANLVKTGQIEFGAQKKETQTAAGIAGKVEVAANELKRFIPLVRQASASLARSNIKSLNSLVQMGDDQISDPQLKTLKGYIVGTLNAYDVLAARGGTDAEKRAENRKQLLSAEGDRAINAALDVIQKESDIAHQSSVEATRVPELSPNGAARPAQMSSPSSKAEYDALPAGSHYSKPGDPPGTFRVKQ